MVIDITYKNRNSTRTKNVHSVDDLVTLITKLIKLHSNYPHNFLGKLVPAGSLSDIISLEARNVQ